MDPLSPTDASSFIHTLQNGERNERVEAASKLFEWSALSEAHLTLRDAGIVDAAKSELARNDPKTLSDITGALCNISKTSEVLESIIQLGAISCIIDLVGETTPKPQANVMGILLAASDRQPSGHTMCEAMRQMGLLHRIVSLLEGLVPSNYPDAMASIAIIVRNVSTQAMTLLQRLLSIDEYRQQLVECGVVPVATQYLLSPSTDEQEAAAQLMAELSLGSDNYCLSDHTRDYLISLIPHPVYEVQLPVLTTLMRLTRDKDIRLKMPFKEMLPVLMEVVEVGLQDSPDQAATLAWMLISDSHTNMLRICRMGYLPLLCGVLQLHDSHIQAKAISLLGALLADDDEEPRFRTQAAIEVCNIMRLPKLQQNLVKDGLLERGVSTLASCEELDDVQVKALHCVSEMIEGACLNALEWTLSLPVVDCLVQLMGSPSLDTRTCACNSLYHMRSHASVQKWIGWTNGIETFLDLLHDPSFPLGLQEKSMAIIVECVRNSQDSRLRLVRRDGVGFFKEMSSMKTKMGQLAGEALKLLSSSD